MRILDTNWSGLAATLSQLTEPGGIGFLRSSFSGKQCDIGSTSQQSSRAETTLDSVDVAVSFFRFQDRLSATAAAQLVPNLQHLTGHQVHGSSCHGLHSNLWGDHNTYRRCTMPGPGPDRASRVQTLRKLWKGRWWSSCEITCFWQH